MTEYGDFYENVVTGERAVVLRVGGDDPLESSLVHLTVKPGGAVVGEHVHPGVTERFTVVAGVLGVRLGGVESTLVAGQSATADPGEPHDWWNAGDQEASVIIELTPPDERFEMMIATLFGLANAGKTNAKGMPNPLQLSLVATEFMDVLQLTKPPVAVQRLVFGLLSPIARRRGYSATYPEYLQPHGRTTPDPTALAAAGLTPPVTS